MSLTHLNCCSILGDFVTWTVPPKRFKTYWQSHDVDPPLVDLAPLLWDWPLKVKSFTLVPYLNSVEKRPENWIR